MTEQKGSLSTKQHLGGLDLVRFYAACLVMIFHLGVVSWSLPISPNYDVVDAPQYPELKWFDIGWVGVEIFFVLSGFVIAQSADGKSAYSFFRSRIGRLLPAIWICATITLIAVMYFQMTIFGPVLSSYLRTLVLYPNGPWISNVYWTLIVEIFFYSSIAVLLLTNAFKYVDLYAAALIAFSGIFLSSVTLFGWKTIHTYWLAQHGCFFGLGILLWLYSKNGFSALRFVLAIIALSLCLVEICLVGNGRLEGRELWLAPATWLLSVLAMFVSTLIVIESNRTRTLGLLTFPLYLVHEKLGSGMLRISPWTGRWVALGFAIAVVMGVSYLVVRLEPPFRRAVENCVDWIAVRIIPQRVLGRLSRGTVSV